LLHDRIIISSGGSHGIRDVSALESALAQPRATFDGVDLYPDLIAKAAALGFLLVANHPFVDGNKRIGHAAMEKIKHWASGGQGLFLKKPSLDPAKTFYYSID